MALVELRPLEIALLHKLVQPVLKHARSEYRLVYRLEKKYDVKVNELHEAIERHLDVIEGASAALAGNVH